MTSIQQKSTGKFFKSKKSHSVILLACLIVIAVYFQISRSPKTLAAIAAKMPAQSWQEIKTRGLSRDLLAAGDGYHILEYIEEACWDPRSRQLMFIGQGHMSKIKHIVYSDSGNIWRELPQPFWASDFGNSYDHHAINPVAGYFYFHPFNTQQVYQYHIASKSWSALPAMPDAMVCCLGMEYFPEMNGLVLAGGGRIYFFDVQKGEWRVIATKLAMGPYHNFAEYNPVHGLMLLGGGNGSRNIYKMDSSGQVTALKDAPMTLGTSHSINTVDPVTGDYLIFGKNAGFYQYDILTDTWSLPSTKPAFGQVDATIACPIACYGVTLFLTCHHGNPRVLLYKHAGAPDAKTAQ